MAKKGFRIGVDLGTANTLVYIDGHGIIYNEPSVVAFDKRNNNVIATGEHANVMLGKEHELIKVIRPMEGGVIANLDATKALLTSCFNRLNNINIDFNKSTLLICCPSEVTSIERVAMKDLAFKIGIKDVFVEEEVKAGAIGAGIDIFASRGSLVIDIGGGTTDIGVLALGDLVTSESLRVAGNYLDREIIKYVKIKYGMAIGVRTAENIKKSIGTLRNELDVDKECVYAGRHLKTGLPRKMVLKQSEIREIFIRAFDSIANIAMKVLQQTPPELSSDIFEDGIIVNGGGALIDGVKEFFEDALNLKVTISPNALTAIVEGSKYLLQNKGNYLIKPID